MTPQKYAQEVGSFIQGGWNTGVLAKYYPGPQKLYAQQVFVPSIPASEGPAAFGLEKEVKPSMWLVHCKGYVTPTVSGSYRFVGAGDDVLQVRFNNKLVLARNWDNPQFGVANINWRPQGLYNYHWPSRVAFPNGGFAKGGIIEVEAGKSYAMEVLIGEQPGGSAMAALLIQKDQSEYERDQYGNLLLPVFRLANGPLPPPKGAGYAPHAEKDGPM